MQVSNTKTVKRVTTINIVSDRLITRKDRNYEDVVKFLSNSEIIASDSHGKWEYIFDPTDHSKGENSSCIQLISFLTEPTHYNDTFAVRMSYNVNCLMLDSLVVIIKIDRDTED